MKSEEKQNPINDNEHHNNYYNTFSQNYFVKGNRKLESTNNSFNKNFSNSNMRKQPTDYKLKTSKSKQQQLPILTLNSLSFYDSLPSENSKLLDVDSLKKKLLLNKTNINKKKAELQELKIQYNKLMRENRNHKNLIYDILQLENEANNSSYVNYNLDGNNYGKIVITEEQLISKINTCKINEAQEKKLKNSFDLINLRIEINNKKKLLTNKINEFDKLNENSKYKNVNEMTSKLEEMIVNEENLKKEIVKLEEILEKNNKTIPDLEKEYEEENKIYEEKDKKEKEYKKIFNDKMLELNKIKSEILNIKGKPKSKKIYINSLTRSPEYNGAKTIGLRLKTKIDKIKYDLKQIDNYKNEKRDDMIALLSERKSKINELKKKNDELESKINELFEKNKDLYMKSMENNEEKKKLENKGKETNKDIKKMTDLENKLNNLTKKKQDLIKECEEKEQNLKNIENEQKEKNKSMVEQLDNLNNNINNMSQQVDELSGKINEMQKDIDNYQEQIDTKKKEIEELKNKIEKKKNEKEEINDNQNTDEMKKENEGLKVENSKLKNKLKLIEEEIQKYIKANEKLAQSK